MPKSETLMLQCSFIYPQTGKKCSNQSENKSYCSYHLLILKCDKNVDINLQQTTLEERTTNLIERVKRIQNSQLRNHISKQLCAFVRYQQKHMNYACQHPLILNHELFLDKNFMLSTLQSQTNISQEDKLKLLSHGYNNFKNLPTSQLVKLVKKFKQDPLQQPLQPPQPPPPQQQPSNSQPNFVNNQSSSEQSKLVNGESSQLNHYNHLNNLNNSTINATSLQPSLSSPPPPVVIKQEQDLSQPTNQLNVRTEQSVSVKEENIPVKSTNRKPLKPTTSNKSNIVVNRKCLAPKFTSDQIKQLHSTTGILRTNLKHFEHSYDSDATESSSGGESCDELDDYLNDLCKQQKLDYNSITPLPLNQKSNWKWALERGSIISRWTWLQAQIADLDFRIRQQNEVYRQFRSSKGQISFYSNESNQPSADGEPQGCVRTLPLKEMKRRKLVRSMFALTNANRKVDRHSTVLCSCNSLPSFSNNCVLCNDRYNYVQMIDTDCMPVTERVALLDPSFHSVLSLPENVSLGMHFSKLLKKETVQRPVLRNTNYKKKKIGPKGELSLKFKNDLKTKKKSQALIQSTKLKKKYEGNNKKHQLLNKKANKVRLNTNKMKKERYDSSNYSDESSRHDSPLPSPFVNNDGSLISSSSLRRRRSEHTAYDPFNIVIPYSIASTTRVERLQYKEILTPKWRVTEDAEETVNEMEIDKLVLESNKSPLSDHQSSIIASPSSNKFLLNNSIEKMDTSEPSQPILIDDSLPNISDSVINDENAIDLNKTIEEDANSNSSEETIEEISDSLEDLSDEIFIERHLKCEADEKKRFNSFNLKNPLNGGSRGRGANRHRTESTKSENIIESNTIDGSSQDSFSNIQFNLNMSTSDKPPTATAKSPGPDTTQTIVFEDNSNQSTKTKIYSLSSKKDEQLFEEDNLVEVIPYEKRNFPLNDNEFQDLLS